MAPSSRRGTMRAATRSGRAPRRPSSPRTDQPTTTRSNHERARERRGLVSPTGGRKSVGRAPVIASTVAMASARSSPAVSGDRSVSRRSCVCPWMPTVCPAATIARTTSGCSAAFRPMTKKVAFTRAAASRSRTFGVCAGLGPSSKVSATPRASRGPRHTTSTNIPSRRKATPLPMSAT